MRVPADVSRLADAVGEGDRRSVARAISIVEEEREGHIALLADLHSHRRGASIVGITGPPGSGKSTLVDAVIALLRARGETPAVLAVDPSSPYTGGAILGDRVRMQRHASDPGVYVRSMASRGHLGGLADAANRALVVLDAAGYSPLLLETVGIGQSEVEVVESADTVVVVTAPGWGDAVQAMKAGIVEAGDVFVVNKADLAGSADLARDLRMAVSSEAPRDWDPPILECSAISGRVDEVWEAVLRHREHLEGSGRLESMRRQRAEATLRRAIRSRLERRLRESPLDEDLMTAVIEGRIDPWSAAERVVP